MNKLSEDIKVIVEKITNDDDMREACEFTIDGKSNMTLDKIYKTEHSPSRTQLFKVKLYNIPTFVSVHLVRHSAVGQLHFVKTNREDRGATEVANRWTPINHLMYLNAQHLIDMSKKRFCTTASKETREIMKMIKDEIIKVDPDLAKYMVVQCHYRGGICQELKSCGVYKTYYNN